MRIFIYPFGLDDVLLPSICVRISLRSKRFNLVSEQRKTGFGRVRNKMRAKK